MKIGPQDTSPLNDTTGPTAGGARAATGLSAEARAALARAGGVASALESATGSTEVRLSPAATAALGATQSTEETIDMDKVRQVQAALARGEYRVNPEAIADELIASAQSFLPKK